MDAASSSSMMSLKKYDVFLSFRGEDTRKSFTSHLYKALIQEKIETFIDNRIEKGDEISPALIKAIEESRVSIVIFSQDYASSKWCLNELIKILQCKKDEGQIVMPVFYNIQPTHVRNRTGSYKKAFARHERDLKLNQDKLHKWKAALTETTYIVGYEFPSDNYRNESDLIKDIVKDVLQKMKHIYPFEVKGLVGIKEKMEEIELLLQSGSSNDIRVIGLWGMGGIGQTTLAKALCGKLCHEFEAYCFLENVREELKSHGLNAVRQRLLSALLEDQNLRLDALYVGNISIMKRLANKKVFLVLDDVSSSKQIEDLFVNHNINSCLGPGSRVIVTTRDKHTCDEYSCEIYEVKELYEKDSLELFSMSAVREKHPKNGYEELSKCVVDYCNGNPLALKVMGANMSRFKVWLTIAWKSEVEKLQKIPHGEIMDILKLSLDDLDYTQMNIFLDIACFHFLRRSSFDDATNILDACSFFAPSGIQVLLDKALITIPDDDAFEMHDLIEEMGQQIVHEESIKDPCMRSRLWKTEEVVHVLKNNKGTEKIEGIVLCSDKVEELSLSSDSLKRMPNLRYLAIVGETNVYFPDGLEWLSDKLRHLCWNGFPLESLPSTFCAELLVVLDMFDSKLKKLWDGVQDLANLRIIILDYCIDLIEMPDLSRATNLRKLSLSHCENLDELCPSILSLPKLAYLYLQHCTKIQSLRSNIHSKSLQKLSLKGCSSLTNFLVTSEKMDWLSLSGTAIPELPSSIWHNTKLTSLDLSDCKQLSIVGNNFISGDDDDPIGLLVFLKVLDLSGCTQMDALNLGILLDSIRSLERLELSGCSNLEALPTNIRKHSMLDHLDLEHCTKLVFSLTELPTFLLSLRAANCTYLDTNSYSTQLLSDQAGPLRFLTDLHLCGCKRIDKSNLAVLLDGIWSLILLNLSGCCNLEALPENIKKHSMLNLILDDCTKLVFSLSDLHLPSLLYLSVVNSIQPLLLENMLPYLSFEEGTYKILLVPGGGQILGKFDFHTTDTASITIPPIQKSGLHSFIFYIILSEGLLLDFDFGLCIRCWIYKNGEEIDSHIIFEDENGYRGKIISDHVLCIYYDNIDETGGVPYNLSFEFKLRIGEYDNDEWSMNGIKGCGVLPVYYDTLELDDGFELTGASRRSGVEIVELECSSTTTAQPSNHDTLEHDFEMTDASRRSGLEFVLLECSSTSTAQPSNHDTLEHDFEMTDASRRSGLEFVLLECSSTSTAQASNHESLVPGVIRNEVEVSTNANEYENEQQQPQLLQLFPPNERKRKRKMRT